MYRNTLYTTGNFPEITMYIQVIFGYYKRLSTDVWKRALNNPAHNKKSPPKDSQLIIRINRVDRDRFVDACAEIDTSAAREIRRFIRAFIDQESDRAS